MDTLLVANDPILSDKERARFTQRFQKRAKRHCSECARILSIHNPDTMCWPCQDAQTEAWCNEQTEKPKKKPLGSPNSALKKPNPTYEKAVTVLKTYRDGTEIMCDVITAALGISHRGASRYMKLARERGILELVKRDHNGLTTYRLVA